MRMKTAWRAVCAAAFLGGAAGAWGEAVRGAINGWGTNWMATNAVFSGDTRWTATVTATQTQATATFKFDLKGDWTTNWGTGTLSTNAVVNGTVGQGHKNSATGSDGGNLTQTGLTNGMRYTFRMDGDHTWWYRLYTIQATTNDPVAVTNVADNSGTAGTNTVTVTAQLSAAPGGERVYVRYTTNSFTSWSQLATGTVSGSTASVQLPGQPAGRTVKYYVLTSTMPTNVLKANYDLCTLRADTAGGTNYSYLVGEAEPVFGNCWHFPTNIEPGTVTMRNPVAPTPSANTYVYAGNYQGDADMTGGWVFYKKSTDGAWSSNSLAYDSTAGDNNYWVGMIPSNAVALGETLQYYLRADYANNPGISSTYLGTSDQADNVKYATAGEAAAHPFTATSAANLGNCWHVPANAEPAGAYMRHPRHPYASNTVTIYSGNQFAGGGNAANQTGGTLYHRLQGAGGWSSTALAFDSEAENNKYWKGSLPAGTYSKTQTVEYVLAVTYSDRDTTYLGANEEGTASEAFASLVAAQAEREGLDTVFTGAGAEWRLPGCSMCLAMNPDKLAPGERCASTSNRNFEGRQGKGGRTHLVSPAVAAATAVRGRLAAPADL